MKKYFILILAMAAFLLAPLGGVASPVGDEGGIGGMKSTSKGRREVRDEAGKKKKKKKKKKAKKKAIKKKAHKKGVKKHKARVKQQRRKARVKARHHRAKKHAVKGHKRRAHARIYRHRWWHRRYGNGWWWRPGHPHHWYCWFFHHPNPDVVVVEGEGGEEGGEVYAPGYSHTGMAGFSVGYSVYQGWNPSGYRVTDDGIGLRLRYKLLPPLGVEGYFGYYDSNWTALEEGRRRNTVGQLSGYLSLPPWSPVTLNILAGGTYNYKIYGDGSGGFFGPHWGLALEVALGRSASLDFDVRHIYLPAFNYVAQSDLVGYSAHNWTGWLGLNLYF